MKKQVNYVARDEFENVLKKLGIPWQEQAGFLKVDIRGNRLYIAKTKECGRVDLADCSPYQEDGFVDLGEDLKFGAVKYQMDFSKTKEEILQNFELQLEHMRTLLPVVKQKKTPAPTVAGEQAATAAPTETAEGDEEASEALDQIRGGIASGEATQPAADK